MSDKSMFSYFITEDESKGADFSAKEKIGKYTFFFDVNTPFLHAFNGDIECAAYGLVVNVITGQSDGIVDEIVQCCKSIQEVTEYERKLGGKYILLFKNCDQYYIQGDATCSVPVFYNTDSEFLCSSSQQNILNINEYPLDNEQLYIRKSGDISQAMPYDITTYRKIRQLLPNHYLDINNQEPVRFINLKEKQKEIPVENATRIIAPLIENLLAFYQSKFKLYCPITSGKDSRVVLAFMMKSKGAVICYTIKHPEYNSETQDIIVPVELCNKVNIKHHLIQDTTVPKEMIKNVDTILGKNTYSMRTLRIAATIKEHFGDGAIINGDIIGQVGKCSLHRDIPAVFATPSYFRCKLHNYSKGAKLQLKKWLEEIKKSDEKVNTFDLFSIENRLGRWAGQENLIYNTIGQIYLNIFNSRSIIYTWTAVSRRKRKKSLLHVDLIKKMEKELLSVPFGNEENILIKFSKSTGIIYLVSSYVKFFIEKTRFEKRKSNETTNNNC